MTHSSFPLAFVLCVFFIPCFYSARRLGVKPPGALVPEPGLWTARVPEPGLWTTDIKRCEEEIVKPLREAISDSSHHGVLLSECTKEVDQTGGATSNNTKQQSKSLCVPVAQPVRETLQFPVEGLILYLAPIVDETTDQDLLTALSKQHANQVREWGHFHISLSSRGKGAYQKLQDAVQWQLLVESLRGKIRSASQMLPKVKTLKQNAKSPEYFFGIEMAPTGIFAAFADFAQAKDSDFNPRAPWNFVFGNGLKNFGKPGDHYKLDLAKANIAWTDAERYWELLTKHSLWQWMIMANNGETVRLLHAEEIVLQTVGR